VNNRRSTVVINSQFQYALLAAIVTVLLVNLFIITNTAFPNSQGFPFSAKQTALLAITEVILIAGVWWGSLISSHKIASPVYVIAR
jgi:hypothetical protein